MTTNRVTLAEAGHAPRTLRAWRAVQHLLADGGWHSHAEIIRRAAETSGVAARTVENILNDARHTRPTARVQTTGRGQQRRYKLRES